MKGDPPSPQFFKCQSFHSNAVWNKNATTRPTVVFEYFDRLIVACNTSPAHWHIEVLKDNDFWMFEPPKNWMFFFSWNYSIFNCLYKSKPSFFSESILVLFLFHTDTMLVNQFIKEGRGVNEFRINRQIFLCVFFEHVPS